MDRKEKSLCGENACWVWIATTTLSGGLGCGIPLHETSCSVFNWPAWRLAVFTLAGCLLGLLAPPQPRVHLRMSLWLGGPGKSLTEVL